ncbi:MAG: serine/threonine protein kinase [Polyangiales bacterium]
MKSGDLVDGRYEILCEVASGGMATVYAARVVGAVGFEKLVALKRMLPRVSADDGYRRMFLDEAKVAAHIHSPYVVSTFDLGEQADGSLYIVMDLVVGSALSSILAGSHGRQLPLDAVATIIEQSARGLHDAHIATNHLGEPLRIVHRDISPQNLLVGIDGAARITDFGVAHAAKRLTKTVGFKVKGKLPYCSPEQARAQPLDGRSDVFALGIVMWEALTLRPLFQRSSPAEILAAHTQPVASPLIYRPEIPPALANIVLRALQTDPSERFQSALEMAEAIRATGISAQTSDIKSLVQEMAGPAVMRLTSSIKRAIANPALGSSAAPPSPLAHPVAARTLGTKTMMALGGQAPAGREQRPSVPTVAAKREAAKTISERPSARPSRRGGLVEMPAQAPPAAMPAQAPAHSQPPPMQQAPGASTGRRKQARRFRYIALVASMLVLGLLLGGIGVYAAVSGAAETEVPPAPVVAVAPGSPTPAAVSQAPPGSPSQPQPTSPDPSAPEVPGVPVANPATPDPALLPDKPERVHQTRPSPETRMQASRARRRARCTNTCQYANDNDCDDGGENSLTGLCAFGTDCNDCGSRSAVSCTNTCQYARDGECDDGGRGSLHAVCPLGTDCADCGNR